MADINAISEYILRRAREVGVDPYTALGIARYEGLNPKTIGSPTFGNKDAKGYSFGPYQLYSASPDPSRIAPGGMAYEFQKQYGAAPSRENWKEQVDFSLNRMRQSTAPWYAVRDQGGIDAITQKGRAFANQIGLGDAPPATTPATFMGMPSRPVTPTPAAPAQSAMTMPNLRPTTGPQPSVMQRMQTAIQSGTPAPWTAAMGIAPTTANTLGNIGGLLSAMMGGGAQPVAQAPAGYENRPDPRKLQELFGGLLT